MKRNVIIFCSLILATLIGICGEPIAYFLYENIVDINPAYYITAVTFTSYFLYLLTMVLVYISFKQNIIGKFRIVAYFFVIGLIGVPTSYWSLFVMAMWWG